MAVNRLDERSKSSQGVKISDLEAYVKKCLENKEFEKQYEVNFRSHLGY